MLSSWLTARQGWDCFLRLWEHFGQSVFSSPLDRFVDISSSLSSVSCFTIPIFQNSNEDTFLKDITICNRTNYNQYFDLLAENLGTSVFDEMAKYIQGYKQKLLSYSTVAKTKKNKHFGARRAPKK